MLKFGDKVISNLYFNDKRISKAYIGSKLVYKEREPIFVDYIENNGGAYINTGILPSYDYTVKIKYQYTGLRATYNPIFGMRTGAVPTGNGLFWTGMHNTSKEVYLRFGGDSVNYALGDKALDIIEITCSPEGIFINGEDTGARYFNGEITSVAKPMYLFTLNGESGASGLGETNAKVYSYEVFDGNMNLIQDLRPCIDPKGVVCMYDIVTEKYFYNKGTGKLTAGPHLLDYIKFDGKSWIDTGITELGGIWTVTASGDDSTQLRFLIGNGGQAANYYGTLSNGKWGLGTASEEYYFENARTSKMTAEVIFEESQATATVDGVTIVRPGTKAIGNFLLCGYQSFDSSNYLFKGDVYHCSYVDTTGKLILDLYPAIDPSGVVCMFDKVSHTYYYNQGSGEIKAGGRFVEYIESTGTQYINTEIIPTFDDEYIIDLAHVGINDNGDKMFFGNRATDANKACVYVEQYGPANNWYVRFAVVNSRSTGSKLTERNQRMTITLNKSSFSTSAGTTLSITNDLTEFNQTPVLLFNQLSGTNGSNRTSKLKLWSFKVVRAGELIQDLRPYLDEDGTPCLYDLVTNVKFYNKGTGTFKYL